MVRERQRIRRVGLKIRTTRRGWRNDGHGIHYRQTLVLLWWQRYKLPRDATSHYFFLESWPDLTQIKVYPAWMPEVGKHDTE